LAEPRALVASAEAMRPSAMAAARATASSESCNSGRSKVTPCPRVPRECQGQNEVSEQMAVRAAGEVRAREKLKC
jgi:hypothetical protein